MNDMVDKRENGSESRNCIGIVVATHCGLAGELIKAAELIVGKMEGVCPLEIKPDMRTQDIVSGFKEAISRVDSGGGVLILTDIFGGTPTNVALSFSDVKVNVVSGVNLPMLIKAYDLRCKVDIEEISEVICDYARRHIKCSNKILAPEG